MSDQQSSTTSSTITHHVWGETSFDQYMRDVPDDYLLWPGVWNRAVYLMRSTAVSLSNSLERNLLDDLAGLPADRKEKVDLIDATLEKLGPLRESVRTNHASIVFAIFLAALIFLHLVAEWILNVSILPELLGSGGEGIFGKALALTASVAPLALERIWGSTTGDEPWDAHVPAKGWRRILLWVIGILNMASLGLVAACRSLSVILNDPMSEGLSPDQQALVSWSLTVLSVTIAVNASMFALYAFHEFGQVMKKRPARLELKRLEHRLKEDMQAIHRLAAAEAKAQSRLSTVKKDCRLREQEFIAQRMLELEKRKTKAESAKDPRALTELVEKIAVGQALFEGIRREPEPDPVSNAEPEPQPAGKAFAAAR